METKRVQPEFSFTKSTGQWQIAGGILFILFFPLCGSYIALAMLTDALRNGVDPMTILFAGGIIGFMMLGIFVPFTLIAALVGLKMISEGRKIIQYDRLLTLHGVHVWGIISDRWTHWSRSRHYCIAYHFEYTGTTGESQTIVHAEYNPLAYKKYQTGMRVPICYLPENPVICRLEMEKEGIEGA